MGSNYDEDIYNPGEDNWSQKSRDCLGKMVNGAEGQVHVLEHMIEQCAYGKEGRDLHYQAGVETNGLEPVLWWVPTVVLEGGEARLTPGQDTGEGFMQAVCREYQRKYHQRYPNC